MIKAGIVDGSGYKAGEMIRLLIHHPDVELKWVSSRTNVGRHISSVHRGLLGDIDMTFTDTPLPDEVDVVFLCHPEGGSSSWKPSADELRPDLRIIDLGSADRTEAVTPDDSGVQQPSQWVYGLSEYYRKPLVRGAVRAVNPSPLAMVLELSLLPLAKHLMLNSDIHVTAVVGSSNAGANLNEDSHTMRNDNVIPSALLNHDDIPEVSALLSAIQNSFAGKIHMLELSGPFSRGIIAVTYLDCAVELPEIERIYAEYYSDHNFTFLSPEIPDLKDVVNTNKCLLHLSKSGSKLVVVAVIDNLLKGSAGNAVHLMNLMFGLHERTGLDLKASAY